MIGQKGDASKLLADATAAAKEVQRTEGKAYALLAVALATQDVGDTKKAVSLLKEAEKAADKVAEEGSKKKILDKVRASLADLEKKVKK